VSASEGEVDVLPDLGAHVVGTSWIWIALERRTTGDLDLSRSRTSESVADFDAVAELLNLAFSIG
jgi:hypothetical protein